MKSVILIGYMCTGKTTVGKALAQQMGLRFYDLDWYIETRYRKRVSEIFAERGEDGFRDIERRMLHETAEFEDIVLACGGGTPCFFDNMDYMNSVGTTIWLDASPDTIIEHYRLSRAVRPLLQGKSGDELRDYITQQLEQRRPFYEKAQHRISVDVLDAFDKINDFTTTLRKQIS